MAVAFRAAGAAGSDLGGDPVVPYPAGVASGDLLVIQFFSYTGVVPNTPSGWTKLFGPITGSGGAFSWNAHLYYKIAGGSEPSSVTFSHTGANNAGVGIMSAYTGADTTTPIDVYATAAGATSGTSGTTPSVTTTKANTMLLRMYWAVNPTSIIPAGTDTERYDSYYSAGSMLAELATSTQATAGVSGTTTATFSGATAGGLGATVAVAPAGTAGAPVANFTGIPLTGVLPLSVVFTDTSTNTPTSWAWTFGDGGTSTSQNPSHSYATAGTYTVVLVATNATGSDTKTRTGYVTVSGPSGAMNKIKWGTGLTVTDEGSNVIRVDTTGGSAVVATDTIWDTKGDLAVATAADTAAKLAAGSNGQILLADSAQTTGLRWATPGLIGTDNIFDAKGDLIAASGPDAANRLAVGSNGKTLTADSAQTLGVKWQLTKDIELKVIDDATTLTTGDGKIIFCIPASLGGCDLTAAHAFVTTVSSSGLPTVQIRNITQTADMLTTKISIDASEFTSYTAAAAPVIDSGNKDVATGDLIAVDVDVAGTGAKGLGVILTFTLP